jgi:hypothetical protein
MFGTRPKARHAPRSVSRATKWRGTRSRWKQSIMPPGTTLRAKPQPAHPGCWSTCCRIRSTRSPPQGPSPMATPRAIHDRRQESGREKPAQSWRDNGEGHRARKNNGQNSSTGGGGGGGGVGGGGGGFSRHKDIGRKAWAGVEHLLSECVQGITGGPHPGAEPAGDRMGELYIGISRRRPTLRDRERNHFRDVCREFGTSTRSFAIL